MPRPRPLRSWDFSSYRRRTRSSVSGAATPADGRWSAPRRWRALRRRLRPARPRQPTSRRPRPSSRRLRRSSRRLQRSTPGAAAAAPPPPRRGRRQAAAPGHRRFRSTGGMHLDAGGRRGLLLLRRQLLSCGVPGQQPGVRHRAAVIAFEGVDGCRSCGKDELSASADGDRGPRHDQGYQAGVRHGLHLGQANANAPTRSHHAVLRGRRQPRHLSRRVGSVHDPGDAPLGADAASRRPT